MDYALENLSPEKFQELCQAIIVKSFPKTQCFSVGQPDGGRDAATSYGSSSTENGLAIFQVKFARKSHKSTADTIKWITDAISKEKNKVDLLSKEGATQYILVTNAKGTAHKTRGTVDRIQKHLDKTIPIPAQCWWRDDINRRLDSAWDIKWSYPEIINGPDILRYIIDNGLSEDRERRGDALKAFLRTQFEQDSEVRFKQVELQNRLLDLFVDIPIEYTERETHRRPHHNRLRIINRIARSVRQDSNPFVAPIPVGAASLLLHSLAQTHLSQVVIEGSPGQGKSTIAQYICQIHRRKLLNESVHDERIPEDHRKHPARIPFKVDCRDFAAWLSGTNPFTTDTQTEKGKWDKTLETFLAAQVRHHSGGADFSVSDLQAIARCSAVLTVFDGLDEVARIDQREQVVHQIQRGIARLREISASTQTIVTSRPAAFTNSPGLPEETFPHLTLAPIDREIALEYTKKWIRARKLQGSDASNINQVLREKFGQPHLRELARNAMQLAILLSLIQTRGGSLPDKRTALYDNYVELFFSRESEKSPIVRDNRELLVDIHRHIAWVLHSEAQEGGTGGSMTTERLLSSVEDFLQKEGHSTALAQDLFSGVVERVVALVSRVEGTYEFEVQPLREYFAARHLYNTAPYSPTGKERKGTLPDRFDALSRDFYWLNVARFYAGCFSKGELPSIVDRLADLCEAEGYKHIGHPTQLTAILLSDWVFTQDQKSLKRAIALIIDNKRLHHIAAAHTHRRRRDAFSLPEKCGSEQLVERCIELLHQNPPPDQEIEVTGIICANSTHTQRTEKWESIIESCKKSEQSNWLRRGHYFGVISSASEETLNNLCQSSDTGDRLLLINGSGRNDIAECCEERFNLAVERVLDGNFGVHAIGASAIGALAESLWPARYEPALSYRSHGGPEDLETYHSFSRKLNSMHGNITIPPFSAAKRCKIIIDIARKQSTTPLLHWSSSLDPWRALTEASRKNFGDRWVTTLLCNLSAGIKSRNERCEHASDLNNTTIPLCDRARYARLRAGATKWWARQINEAPNEHHLITNLLFFLTWSGQKALEAQARLIDEKLIGLSRASWDKLGVAIARQGAVHSSSHIKLTEPVQATSQRTIAALTPRIIMGPGAGDSAAMIAHRLRKHRGNDHTILHSCLTSALSAATNTPDSWENWLPLISRMYTKGVDLTWELSHRLNQVRAAAGWTQKTAKKIASDPQKYPLLFAATANETCTDQVARTLIPVGQIARKDEWFD